MIQQSLLVTLWLGGNLYILSLEFINHIYVHMNLDFMTETHVNTSLFERKRALQTIVEPSSDMRGLEL